MIKGELLNGNRAAKNLKDKGSTLQTNLTKSIARLVLVLMVKVKGSKLSGQVLNVRTGRLRRSINQRVEGINTPVVAGYVGTNVKYARPHEYGFEGSVNVKQSLRMQVMAWGRPIEPVQTIVRAHKRAVTLPERSFLRSALADMTPQIRRELVGAVTEAIK